MEILKHQAIRNGEDNVKALFCKDRSVSNTIPPNWHNYKQNVVYGLKWIHRDARQNFTRLSDHISINTESFLSRIKGQEINNLIGTYPKPGIGHHRPWPVMKMIKRRNHLLRLGKQKDLIKEKTWHKVASGTSEDNASSDMQFCFRKKHQLWFWQEIISLLLCLLSPRVDWFTITWKVLSGTFRSYVFFFFF